MWVILLSSRDAPLEKLSKTKSLVCLLVVVKSCWLAMQECFSLGSQSYPNVQPLLLTTHSLTVILSGLKVVKL